MGIPQLTSSKILLIGDSCIDEYLIGYVDRLSPEAPVPIVDVIKTRCMGGMAANVLSNLVSLGNEVDFHTNNYTLKKTRVIDAKSNQQLLRIDLGGEIDSFDIASVLSSPTKYDAFVVSDYDKGFISLDSLIKLVEIGHQQGVPIFIDSKKINLLGIEDCFIKINKKEYDLLTMFSSHNEFIITLGDKGAKWKDTVVPTKKRSVFDVCGAGDTFLAAFVSAYLSGSGMVGSIEFANECASVAVTKLGCHVITLKDLEN